MPVCALPFRLRIPGSTYITSQEWKVSICLLGVATHNVGASVIQMHALRLAPELHEIPEDVRLLQFYPQSVTLAAVSPHNNYNSSYGTEPFLCVVHMV